MLLADVTRKVQRLFGDSNGIFITPQDIVDWVNEARIRIAREANFQLNTGSFTASAGTYTFNTATAIPAISRVIYGDKFLPYIPLETLDAQGLVATQSGVPEYYYHKGQAIYLYPVPHATDSTTVTVETNGINIDLTTGSTALGVPVQYHDDIVLFCTARAHHRNQDHRAAERVMGEFESNLSKRVHEANHPAAEFSVVRDDPWDYYDWTEVL